MQDERRLATINQPKITAFLAVREIVEKVGDKLRTTTRMAIVQRLWIASLGPGNCAVCMLPYSNALQKVQGKMLRFLKSRSRLKTKKL